MTMSRGLGGLNASKHFNIQATRRDEKRAEELLKAEPFAMHVELKRCRAGARDHGSALRSADRYFDHVFHAWLEVHSPIAEIISCDPCHGQSGRAGRTRAKNPSDTKN